jgi:hypothetical protein
MSYPYVSIILLKVDKGYQQRKVGLKMTTLIKNKIREITLENVSADEANLIVCVFCSDYAGEVFCGNCKEYKGIMTLGEWLSYTQESWVL